MNDPSAGASPPRPPPPLQRNPSENAVVGGRNSSSSIDNNSNNDNANTSLPPTTAQWTQWLPEAYGIRRAVEASKYRWCAREAGMWGIATGTTMALHRLRMASPTSVAIHAGFATTLIVYTGSYYFCTKRRDYQEHMIELMMKLNSFDTAANMPEERPLDASHPFVEPAGAAPGAIPQRQYVANLPERKEWQSPLPTQDAEQVFRPVADRDGSSNDQQ